MQKKRTLNKGAAMRRSMKFDLFLTLETKKFKKYHRYESKSQAYIEVTYAYMHNLQLDDHFLDTTPKRKKHNLITTGSTVSINT